MKHFPNNLKVQIANCLELRDEVALSQLLRMAVAVAKTPKHWFDLRLGCESIPTPSLSQNFDLAYNYARVLVNCSDENTVLEFTEQISEFFNSEQQAQLLLERTWALLVYGQFAEARDILLQILESTTDNNTRGKAAKRLLWAKHRLVEDWSAEEKLVRDSLDGYALGLALIDIGQCFYLENNTTSARTSWLEALALVEGDSLQETDLASRLGISYLRELNLEKAQRYLQQAEKRSQHASAKSMRVLALCNLAAFFRVRGEFQVAIELYQTATKLKLSTSDKFEALLNLDRTQRLMGLPDEAIVTFNKAKIKAKNDSGLWIELAAVYLLEGYFEKAQTTLEKSIRGFGADFQLQVIIEAEFLRLNHQFDAALEKLRGLPIESRLLREEVVQFKQLFTFANASGLPVPKPLNYYARFHFEIFTQGSLTVYRNGINLDISRTARYAQIFLMLLDQPYFQATAEKLGYLVLPEEELMQYSRDQRRDIIDHHVNDLRKVLGYKDSIKSHRGVYSLDPKAVWTWDVVELRQKKQSREDFCEEMDSLGINELRHEIQQLGFSQRILN